MLNTGFEPTTCTFLVVGISDAALTAACDGGKADLRYGPKLVDARVGELITAVNAERIAGFPNGPLFLDSAEQELRSSSGRSSCPGFTW